VKILGRKGGDRGRSNRPLAAGQQWEDRERKQAVPSSQPASGRSDRQRTIREPSVVPQPSLPNCLPAGNRPASLSPAPACFLSRSSHCCPASQPAVDLIIRLFLGWSWRETQVDFQKMGSLGGLVAVPRWVRGGWTRLPRPVRTVKTEGNQEAGRMRWAISGGTTTSWATAEALCGGWRVEGGGWRESATGVPRS